MSETGPGTSAAGWALYLLVVAAAGVAVGLQLLIAETPFLERAITVALVLVGIGFLSWAFFGGMNAWVQRREENRVRRHIRYHPLIVDDFRSLVALVGEVFGERGHGFREAASSLTAAWSAVNGAAGQPRPFTPSEAEHYRMASSTLADSSYLTGTWPGIRNTLYWLTDGPNRRDSHAFSYASLLLWDYLSSCLSMSERFVLSIQQCGLDRLNPVMLGQWEQFARRANAMIDDADRIARRSVAEAGVGVGQPLERVIQHLTAPAASR